MIWAVGDLHGMCDPLKMLTSELRKEEARGNPVEKVIFLGDLVDHGPSSKEVLEIIRDFPWPVVTLLGNHEQMMLDYLAGKPHYWFPGNGGGRTLASFGLLPQEPPPTHLLKSLEPVARWVEQWPLIHREDFQLSSGSLAWYFTHAGLSPVLSPENLRDLRNYKDLPAWMERHRVALEDTCLWTRAWPQRTAENTVVVSGHTPTSLLPSLGVELGAFDPAWGVPYLTFEGYRPRVDLEAERGRVRWSGRLRDLFSINLDTGAVYGGTLTALGLSKETLEKGILPLKIISTGQGYRNRLDPDLIIQILS